MAEMAAGSSFGVAEVDAAVVTSTAAASSAPAPLPTCVELPSFETARALAENRYSCLVVVSHRRHIALPPRFLNRKRTGICAQLDAELRRYSDSFQGVPVAYDDIKITKELGDIIDDIGAIHLDIEATFVAFQPKPGKKLVGIINKVAPSHIGCLVHECFNASIPKPDHISTEDWKNYGFQIGNRLVFKVLHFDSDAAGVFCIRGKLCKNRKSIQYIVLLILIKKNILNQQHLLGVRRGSREFKRVLDLTCLSKQVICKMSSSSSQHFKNVWVSGLSMSTVAE